MRMAQVLYKDEKAGILSQQDDGAFTFKYEKNWVENASKPSISLTLPKREEEYRSKYLFPFFYSMLPEGSNKHIVCKYNRIDVNDYFSILMAMAREDTIGAVSLTKIEH